MRLNSSISERDGTSGDLLEQYNFLLKICMKKEIEEQMYKQDLLNLTIWILQHLSFLHWKEKFEKGS